MTERKAQKGAVNIIMMRKIYHIPNYKHWELDIENAEFRERLGELITPFTSKLQSHAGNANTMPLGDLSKTNAVENL